MKILRILSFALLVCVTVDTTSAFTSSYPAPGGGGGGGENAPDTNIPKKFAGIVDDLKSEFGDMIGFVNGDKDQTNDLWKELAFMPPNYTDTISFVKYAGNITITTNRTIVKVTLDDSVGVGIFRFKEVDGVNDHGMCLSDNDCVANQYCKKGFFSWSNICTDCISTKDRIKACEASNECCSGSACQYGKCTEGVTDGEAGTTCDIDADCDTETCCANTPEMGMKLCKPYGTEGVQCLLPAVAKFQRALGISSSVCPCDDDYKCRPVHSMFDQYGTSVCIYDTSEDTTTTQSPSAK